MSKQGTAEESWNRTVAFLIRQHEKESKHQMHPGAPSLTFGLSGPPQTLFPSRSRRRGPPGTSQPHSRSSKHRRDSAKPSLQVGQPFQGGGSRGPGFQFVTPPHQPWGWGWLYSTIPKGKGSMKLGSHQMAPSGLGAPYVGPPSPSPTFKSREKVIEPGGGAKSRPMFVFFF